MEHSGLRASRRFGRVEIGVKDTGFGNNDFAVFAGPVIRFRAVLLGWFFGSDEVGATVLSGHFWDRADGFSAGEVGT